MQGAPPVRYVSVSELYSTDEVELLLDEIRDLEPTSCRGEDVQDFEIAGSGLEAAGGGRSPAGTEVTERSWDSHAHYSRVPPPLPQPLAPIYCRLDVFLTGAGICSLCACLCSVSAAVCVAWSSPLRARTPLGARLRLLQLAALTSALTHAGLLVARVTRLAALLPLPWRALTCVICVWCVTMLAAGGGGALHALLTQPATPSTHTLIAAASLCLCGALFSALCGASTLLRAARPAARRVPALDPALDPAL